MDPNRAETEIIERAPVDINEPGVLVHGIDIHNPKTLAQIFKDGLKPRNTQVNPRQGFTEIPDYVSFSMVYESFERSSASWMFGANNNAFNTSLSLVLDPEYVKSHSDDFKAVGPSFEKHPVNELFCDSSGQIFNGIQFMKLPQMKDLFADEVVAKYVPPEAIIGVISKTMHIESTKEKIKALNLDRKITLYDVEGNAYNL